MIVVPLAHVRTSPNVRQPEHLRALMPRIAQALTARDLRLFAASRRLDARRGVLMPMSARAESLCVGKARPREAASVRWTGEAVRHRPKRVGVLFIQRPRGAPL